MLKKITKDDLKKTWEKQQAPGATVRDCKPDEKENDLVHAKPDTKFTDEQIEMLFPKKALSTIGWNKPGGRELAYNAVRSCLAKMRVHSLKTYTVIRDRNAHTFKSTDQYPVFMFDEGKFKLIYHPLNEDPDGIYQYYGERPDFYLHGQAQAGAFYQKQLDDQEEPVSTAKRKGRGKAAAEPAPKKKKIEKIPKLIMVPEPADAFGPSLMGYFTLFHGGTSNVLMRWDFVNLAKICDNVYQIRNNTDLHKELAHLNALEHLDLVTVELPEVKMDQLKDMQLVRRDILNLRDYLTWHNDHDFEELLDDSMPYRFWDTMNHYVGTGDDRTHVGYKYDFSYLRAYNFLTKQGFYRFPVEGEKNDYVFIRMDGNIIRKSRANDVKNFINKFLKDRRLDHDLRDYIYERGQLSESSLSNLEETEIDFKDFDAKRQFMFFNNGTYEVTANDIALHPAGKIKRYVWDTDVIDHDISPADCPFKITALPDDMYDIEILHNDCLFFNYLIQTSRMHWRKEFENAELKTKADEDKYRKDHQFNIASELLSAEERNEQKQHLINKIFALGYLMHRNKNRSQAWAVVAVDNNTPADGKSYGGTGKSITFNQALIKVAKNHHRIPGTNPDVTKNPHIFHGLKPQHRVLIIDDADKNLNFRFFFEFITDNQVVNPKNNAPYTIPFEELAKLVWLTNFSFLADPSTNRRILYTAFSDYYHAKSDKQEAYEPKDDFGLELFTDFKADEYNRFYNTMSYFLQFFLQCPVKLSAPMKNVDKRNMQREMGAEFEIWASLFFSEKGDNLNKIIVKSEAYKDFKNTLDSKFSYSSSKFKTSLGTYCRYQGYIFNPEELINDKQNERITFYLELRKFDASGFAIATGQKKTEECIYIQTEFEKPLNSTPPEYALITKN